MTEDFKFYPGERVRIRKGPPELHCRVPTYLRGQVGQVTDLVGRYRNPSLMAIHKPGLPMVLLYRIRFNFTDLWNTHSCQDSLIADIYEHWIEKWKGN